MSGIGNNSLSWRLATTISLPIVITGIYMLVKRYSSTTSNKDKSESSTSHASTSKPQILKRQVSNSNFTIVEDSRSARSVEKGITQEKGVIAWNSLGLEQPLVIAMVGLPARGKSYIVKMIIRYLKWTGFQCDVFNVGSYRRQLGLAAAEANFFEAGNKDGQRVREEMAMAVQDEMYAWLHRSEGTNKRVAIFDATNTTISRRLALADRARKENVFLLFVESICDDATVLTRNYNLKLQNDDYKGMDGKKALSDFMERVQAYEKVYETIQDDENSGQISYIKLINVGQKVITRNCTGYLPSQVAFYLQNVHIEPRRIYFSLTAEGNSSPLPVPDDGSTNEHDAVHPVGLTDTGSLYSLNLTKFIQSEQEASKDLASDVLILAGTSDIEAETILHLRMLCPCYNTPLLNELRAGDFHGLTKDEFETHYPNEHAKRVADKLNYRYPGVGGESYLDVIERIRPVIIELERQRRSVLVVCHLAVLRCIYAYFTGAKVEDIPHLEFRQHTLYQLTPGPFGCKTAEIDLSSEFSYL